MGLILAASVVELLDLSDQIYLIQVVALNLVEMIAPLRFQVVEQGMFVKHCKVEVYLTELKLCEDGNMDNMITRRFSKADTIGRPEALQLQIQLLLTLLQFKCCSSMCLIQLSKSFIFSYELEHKLCDKLFLKRNFLGAEIENIFFLLPSNHGHQQCDL